MHISSSDFGRRFIYVAALPKSASSHMWLIASALQESDGRADPSKMPDTLPSPYLPLQFELMDRFPRGGVLSGHAPLTFDTNLFLRGTLCRYIVHLRHPADFIVALYCHGAGGGLNFVSPEMARRVTFGDEQPWKFALSAIESKVFDEATSIDEALTRLLRDGALFKAMSWMCDWLAHRDPALSAVSTYEALMSDFDGTIDRLCRFVRGASIDVDRLNYLRHCWAHNATEGQAKESNRYPRGWTGAVDVWRRYFTAKHIEIYNDVVRQFLASYPRAEILLGEYPNTLLLTTGDDDGPRTTAHTGRTRQQRG